MVSDSNQHGQRLKILKQYVGLSQRELGRTLGVSRSLIAKILRGDQHISTRVALRLHGQWPDLNLHWLFTGEGKPFVSPESQEALAPRKVLWCSGLKDVLEPEEKAAVEPGNHYKWVPEHMLDREHEYRLVTSLDDALEPRIPEGAIILLRKGEVSAERAHGRFGLVYASKDGDTSHLALRHCLLSEHEDEEKLYILPVQKPWKYRPRVLSRKAADSAVKALLVAAWLNYGKGPPRCEDSSENA